MLKVWFNYANHEIRDTLIAKLGPTDSIVNIISSLNLVEYVIRNEFEEEHTISDSDFEINLLKAYLVLNDQQLKLENDNLQLLPPEDADADERLIASMITINFHDSDLMNYEILDILIPQIVKSVIFFQYLDNRQELKHHLDYFLKMYECDSWEQWITQYLALVLPAISQENKSYFDFEIPKDNDYERNCRFLDSLSVVDESGNHKDYIQLRSNPLIKISNGRYRVINTLFLMEKMFKSIQFLFSLKINNELPKEYKLKNFRADHCDMFSEQTLLYKVIADCFPKKWVHISGQDFKASGYEGEPDYYLRFKNKIFFLKVKMVFLTRRTKAITQL